MTKRLLVCCTLALSVLLANAAVFYITVQRQKEAAHLVANTLTTIDALRDIQVNLANVEINQRRYIVGNAKAYLEHCLQELKATITPLDQLDLLTASDLKQQEKINVLRTLIAAHISRFAEIIKLHQSAGFSAALQAMKASKGASVDRMQRLIVEITAADRKLLSSRAEQSSDDSDLAFVTFMIAGVFDFVLLCAIVYLGHRELRDRAAAQQALAHAAAHDPLTSLPNRLLLAKRLDRALKTARAGEKRLAVLFIDLDRFKNINDTVGHEAGDRLLKDIALRLSECVRRSDTVARQGGDEFVVLIQDYVERHDLVCVAEKILSAVSSPLLIAGKEFHVTASIGVAISPDDGCDMQTLLKNADIAMYRAKAKGKNDYQFYAETMNDYSFERLHLESALHSAIERNEFLLYYQPKINTQTGQIIGMEALIRWRHPERGLLAPNEWVSIAEETGIIVPIGKWILKEACAQTRAWQQQGLQPGRVAVNLSARQFAQATLLDDIQTALQESGLDPCWLELEITESMVMHDPEDAVRLLKELKAMGITLAIDDFGTGYSSLAYLKRFPIDTIKIDRSFIRDICDDHSDAGITKAIIAMAHSLKLSVVAEGVETEAQLKFLREHHCEQMQGYYFSVPLGKEEFAQYVLEKQSAQRNQVILLAKRKLRAKIDGRP